MAVGGTVRTVSAAVAAVVGVTTVSVPAVHHQVHQRAGEEQQVRKGPEQVCPVLLPEDEHQRARGQRRRQPQGATTWKTDEFDGLCHGITSCE